MTNRELATNYFIAMQLMTDDYALDLSCTDYPNLESFIADIDAALTTPDPDNHELSLLDSIILDLRTLDFPIADDIDAKRIRAYYAANSILNYDTMILFSPRDELDRILARPDSTDLLA